MILYDTYNVFEVLCNCVRLPPPLTQSQANYRNHYLVANILYCTTESKVQSKVLKKVAYNADHQTELQKGPFLVIKISIKGHPDCKIAN